MYMKSLRLSDNSTTDWPDDYIYDNTKDLIVFIVLALMDAINIGFTGYLVFKVYQVV